MRINFIISEEMKIKLEKVRKKLEINTTDICRLAINKFCEKELENVTK